MRKVSYIFLLSLILVALLAIVAIAGADEDEGLADPFELALKANDGVSSLPVFKGPFPETENMQFLSQQPD